MKIYLEFPVLRVTVIAMFLAKAFFLTAQHSLLGTTDINRYIRELPALPKTAEAAAINAYGKNPLMPDNMALDKFYEAYEAKLNQRIAEYQAFAKQKMTQGGATEADYRQETAAMANKNPIVANMGGYDKVSKMNEAEAKAAAEQASAQYVADPFAANGVQSAGMSALYQKIISDPAYAKQFENMSDAEKEAELRKYMANDRPATKTPAEMAQYRSQVSQQQSQADRIRNAQEIQMKLLEYQQQLGTVGMAFGSRLQEIAQTGNNHDAISKEYAQRYNAIPMVSLGEYGHDHDPEKVRPLRLAEAKAQLERAQQELKDNTAALAEASGQYQAIVTDYLSYLKQNYAKIYGGTTAKDMLEATNTEQPLLSFESSLLGLGLQLSGYAKDITKEAANWQTNYLRTLETYK